MIKNEGLRAGLEEYNRKLASGEVERSKPKTPFEKWEEHKTSLRKCINAYCWQCTCEQRKEIRFCEATDCPLWLVRPYREK